MREFVHDIIARNRAGEAAALVSVCSAHHDVLRACLMRAETLDQPLLVEATSNQVNQDGGYAGMQPADYIAFVQGIADRAGVARERIVFGGDHLGPQAWRAMAPERAMAKARKLVHDYVAAGFCKIHLDCSQGLMGEAAQPGDGVTAARSAELAEICLSACDDAETLGFVIGTEVPPPGGAHSDATGDIAATTPAAAAATLAAHGAVFPREADIVGLVVQPGVEFSPMQVQHLPPGRDPGLKAVALQWPGLCLEAHSTDYQRPEAIARLAGLGFGFLKVGPALTFAWRRAIYGLDMLRAILGGIGGGAPATLHAVMEELMLDAPGHWQGHYHGDAASLAIQRHFGLADRIRYYWPHERAQAALRALLDDLKGRALPEPLLAQVFCADVLARAEALAGVSAGAPTGALGQGGYLQALIDAQVQVALDPYFFTAPRPGAKGGAA